MMKNDPVPFRAHSVLVGGAAVLVAATAMFIFGSVLSVIGGTAFVRADDDERLAPLTKVDATWQAECSACHMAYPPGLLPWRAWEAMLGSLDDHFGENATLSPAQTAAVAAFLRRNAADVGQNRLSRKLAASASGAAAPVRISTLPYIRREHDEISAATFARPEVGGRANCVACHRGAERGDFSEDDVDIPTKGERK